MRVHSTITDRFYIAEEMAYITNPTQIAKYIDAGAVLFDLIPHGDKLVGVFSKKESAVLYVKWQKREI